MRHSLLLSLFLLVGVATVTAAVRRPNILIAVADDWSFPHATAYGVNWVRTPAFDRVAQEGVLFLNAYTPVSKCSSSRASLLTGRNPWQLGPGFTHWSTFPPEVRSIGEALSAAGYRVGHTGKGWGPGVALQADRRPRALLGTGYQKRKLPEPPPSRSANDYAGNFVDFLDAAPAEASWFFWYGGTEPHRPYEAGSGRQRGGKAPEDIRTFPAHWPDHPTVRSDLLDYALEVEHFDAHLGRMLAELERRGQLDNTLVIVTSDNGMPFPRAKGQCYDISVHLPLAIRWPQAVRHPGRTVDDYVALPELVPTLVEAAGLDPAKTGLAPAPGRSLLPLLTSDREGRIDATRDHVLIGRERHDPGRPQNQGYPVRGIIVDGLLYLRNYEPDRWPSGNPETGYLDVDSSPTKSLILANRRIQPNDPHWLASFGKRPDEELYDLNTDPDCVENVIGHLDRAAARFSLADRMTAALTAQGDPRVTGPRFDLFDSYAFSNPDFVDFYERFMAGQVGLPRSFESSDVDPKIED